MKRFLLLALTAGLSMPCLAQGKEIIYSKLPSYERAIGLASIKTGYECREIFDGPMTKEQTDYFFRMVNVSKEELSGPVVNILYREFKKYISEDCRSFDKEEVNNAAKRTYKKYDLRFVIPVQAFGLAASIIAKHDCGLDIGIYKNGRESGEAILRESKESGLPKTYVTNDLVHNAALEIKPFFTSDCTDLNDPNERAGEIIFKYFDQQQQ